MNERSMKVVFTEKDGNFENPVVQAMIKRLNQFSFVFCKSEKEIVENLPDSDVLITSGWGIGESHLTIAPSLKLVQYIGTGYDSADLEACSKANVMVANVPSRGSGNAESVAETVIMHMLILAKKQAYFKETFKNHRLYSPEGITLWKKRALVIGLGNLGHTIAERLIALGMKVQGANRTARAEFSNWGLEKVFSLNDLSEAARGCRFVILALPSKTNTVDLIGRDILKSMDRDSWIINVARPGILNRNALQEALDKNWIAGAALDVIWDEPIDPEDSLFDDPRLSLSPHVGGATDEFSRGVFAHIEENLKRLKNGKKPLSIVN